MAEMDYRQHNGVAKFSVYVLDVLPLSDGCKYELYVGSTWKEIKHRHEEHKDGGSKSARIFRKSASVGDIRWDLMEGFPKFYSREAAERAEGRVAMWLVHKGFQVRCNMLENE